MTTILRCEYCGTDYEVGTHSAQACRIILSTRLNQKILEQQELLNLIPKSYRVHVREGGAGEGIDATLAVSVAKMVRKLEAK